jgi:hypothetical protein
MLCPLLVALHTITWSLAILRGLATEWHISNYAIEVRFDYYSCKATLGLSLHACQKPMAPGDGRRDLQEQELGAVVQSSWAMWSEW